MKKIIIIVVLGLITIAGCIVGYKYFYVKPTKNTKNTSKPVQNNGKSKNESKENKINSKETHPSVRENIENKEESSVESQNNNIQNDTNYSNNTSQNNNSTQSASQNVIQNNTQQNNTQQNVVQEERPQVDPNTTDTSHYLYSMHHGIITKPSYSECQDAGYSVQRTYPDKNLSHSCYEVYNISGGIKGYYLDVTEDGRDANYLKSSLGLN